MSEFEIENINAVSKLHREYHKQLFIKTESGLRAKPKFKPTDDGCVSAKLRGDSLCSLAALVVYLYLLYGEIPEIDIVSNSRI